MSTKTEALVVQPGEGPMIAVVGDLYRFLAVGGQTSGRYALWEALVPPGGGPPPHIQSLEDEGFYVLEGEVAFYAHGGRVLARKGTFLNIPVGVLHHFRNETQQEARMLILVAPAGLEGLFFEAGAPASGPDPHPVPPSPQDIQKIIEAAARYGVEIRPPAAPHHS